MTELFVEATGAEIPPALALGRPISALLRTSAGRQHMREHGITPVRNRGNQRVSKFEKARFVAWDGEGISERYGEPQSYVLFGNSDGAYIVTEDSDHTLSTDSCLELLLAADRRAVHVIFAGQYDVNMILCDLSPNQLERLWRTNRVYYKQYSLHWLPGKKFTICDRATERKITLWDVFTFFQSSFVKVLEAWKIGDAETIARIKAGKSSRNTFRMDDLNEIVEYWQAELRCLVELMREFRRNLIAAGFVLNRWDGPGAVAACLYKKYGTKQHKLDTYKHDDPMITEVGNLAQIAYAGGRFEQVQYGNLENADIRVYDINSAYPAEIAKLPSLAGATWRHHRGNRARSVPMSLYHIAFHDPVYLPIAPLWHRQSNGQVAYGNPVEGWYWTPEYEAARKVCGTRAKVLEWYEFVGDVNSRPFAWVADMYDQRLQWKAEGKAAEKCLKLGLNSLYGKMVQQTGWREPRNGETIRDSIPPFHQLEWGGYVTSAVRAKLWLAAMANPLVVVGMETDGIITEGELPGLDLGSGLGQWGETRYRSVTYVQSGMYWLQTLDGTWLDKRRGIDPGSVTREAVLDVWRTAWERNKRCVVNASLTRFRGLGQTMQSGDWYRWRSWETAEREITVVPINFNRRAHCLLFDPRDAAKELMITQNYQKGEGLSHKYPIMWKDGTASYDLPLDEDRWYMDKIERTGTYLHGGD